MSEPKRPSYNALLRKIERLEAELAEVRQSQAKSFAAMREYLQSIRMGTKDFEGRMTHAGMLVGKVRKKMAVGWNEAVGATNIQAYVIQTDLSDILPNLGNNDAQETDGTSTGE